MWKKFNDMIYKPSHFRNQPNPPEEYITGDIINLDFVHRIVLEGKCITYYFINDNNAKENCITEEKAKIRYKELAKKLTNEK